MQSVSCPYSPYLKLEISKQEELQELRSEWIIITKYNAVYR